MENGDKPAIPCTIEQDSMGRNAIQVVMSGLSKREYFAAMAMQGLLANGNPWTFKECVDMADEVLNVLEET